MSNIAAKFITHSGPREPSHSIRAKTVVFSDPKSRALLDQIERIAPTDTVVLVNGESGTGKELIARHIHEQSGRTGPFVAVNCGALSQSIAEAELFGHQAGAFTGATETRAGWFEAANNGTLFLDEIGDLPTVLQVKLLRVLQEREVVRVGSRKAIPLNVRLVAATNVDLAAAVSAGRFRLDLYYRLNVFNVVLPPLRERRDDIPPLVEYFIRTYWQRQQGPAPTLLPETWRALLHYPWPGNIRELENVIHVALVVADDGVIKPSDLRFAAAPHISTNEKLETKSPLEAIATQLERLFSSPPRDLYRQLEEVIFREAFHYCSDNQVQTAKLLGITRNVLRTHLKYLGLIGGEDMAVGEASQTNSTDVVPDRLLVDQLRDAALI